MSKPTSQDSKQSSSVRYAVALLAVAILLQVVAVCTLSFSGYDSPFHITWIREWHTLWNAGIFYPRWLPGSYRGFGAPSFYFYPPLTYVFTSALYAVLPHVEVSTIAKVIAGFAFLASGLSMWLYLRWRATLAQTTVATSSMRTAIPILAALLYTFAPYQFFDYAVRGALSEHVALVFVPLVFWAIDLLAERRKPGNERRGILLLIVALTLLFITNLPAATVTGMGALVYVLAQDRQSRVRLLGALSRAAIAAVLLSAFYLLPVVTLFGDAQFGRLWHPASVVMSSPFLAIFTGKSLTIDSYTFLSLAGACIVFVGLFRAKDRSANFWLIVIVLAVQLPFVSQFLFNFVPPFTIVQISYRFTILLLIVLALLWQEELSLTNENIPRIRHFASLVVVLWSLGSIGLVSLQLADVHVHKHDLLPIDDAPEYAPRWQQPYYDFGESLSAPFASDSQNAVGVGRVGSTDLRDKREPYSDTIDYDSPTDGQVLFRRSYWPTWKARIDGVQTATTPDSLGRLSVLAPAGHHRIIVWLETSSVAKIGSWISVGTLFLLSFFWLNSRRRKFSKNWDPNHTNH